MKKLLLILLCLPIIGFGQGWEKTINNNNDDVGYSIQQTTDGGYIIGGRTQGLPNASFAQGKAWLVKTDYQGNTEWINDTYNNSGNHSSINSVQQTLDGGYIALGFLQSYIWLIKTNSLGDTLWTKLHTTSLGKGTSVQQTLDGGYIMTGDSDTEICLIKTDFQGNEIWNTTLGQGEGKYVQQTSDGGYIVAGIVFSGVGINADARLIKTNSLGNTLWTKTYSTGIDVTNEYFSSVQQTPDGGYILTCSFQDGDVSFCLIKTDSQGVEVWNQIYEGPNNDYARYGDLTNDGGYFIFGETTSQWDHGNGGAGTQDFWLIKTNSLGDTLWTRIIGGPYWERGFSAKQTADGGYILVGLTSLGPLGYSDLYLVKLNSFGNITSTNNISLDIEKRKIQRNIDLLGRETKQTNQPLFYIYDDGTVEKRIIIE